MTQEEYSAVCPYLGLADDADSHATYATEAHRCYRLTNPTRIATPHQENYCLGANLARLEAQVALRALLARTRSFARIDAAPLPLHPSIVFRGVRSLPIVAERA